MVEYFDVVEVCCEIVVACVEPKFATAWFLGLFLLFSHVDLMFATVSYWMR
jgi:hypothetical protein